MLKYLTFIEKQNNHIDREVRARAFIIWNHIALRVVKTPKSLNQSDWDIIR